MVVEAALQAKNMEPEQENGKDLSFYRYLFAKRGDKGLITIMGITGPGDSEENRLWQEWRQSNRIVKSPEVAEHVFAYRQKQAGLAGDLRLHTFDAFEVRSGSQGHALSGCRRHAKQLRQAPRGIALFGDTGVGKSHLAAAIINADLRNDKPLRHVWVECLELYRDEYRKAKEQEIEARNAEHVILNDLDKATGGNTTEARLFVATIIDKADKGEFLVTITSQIGLYGLRGPDGKPLLDDEGNAVEPGFDFYLNDYQMKRLPRIAIWELVDGPDGRDPQFWPDEAEPWAR